MENPQSQLVSEADAGMVAVTTPVVPTAETATGVAPGGGVPCARAGAIISKLAKEQEQSFFIVIFHSLGFSLGP
jgi:hypothetical protein